MQPDTVALEHTYSWGNEYDENGKGLWFIDQIIDRNAANEAINNPAVRGERVGGDLLDTHIDKIYKEWQGNPNHASRHANSIITRNCKTETTRLTNSAKASLVEASRKRF